MSFRGSFEWYNSLHQGGKRAISFTLTCKNMFKTETFDCAIIDSTGQQPTQVRRQLKLKPNESLIFNYDRCRWDWCQGDYFCILGKGDKVEQRWDLNLKIYARGECPDCHGSHRCYNCNGSGVIRNQHTHTVDTCQTCNGTGICQKCYVPIRSGSTLAQEVYGAQPLPNSELSKKRKIVALQQTISDLEGRIAKADMDMRMMQLKGLDVSARMAYMSQVEMLHAFQRQLINAQHELQQLQSML
jgi:hypothetical protein